MCFFTGVSFNQFQQKPRDYDSCRDTYLAMTLSGTLLECFFSFFLSQVLQNLVSLKYVLT